MQNKSFVTPSQQNKLDQVGNREDVGLGRKQDIRLLLKKDIQSDNRINLIFKLCIQLNTKNAIFRVSGQTALHTRRKPFKLQG